MYLEYQGSRKDSGLLPELELGEEPDDVDEPVDGDELAEPGGRAEPGDEVNRGRQVSALFTYGVTDRLTLSTQLPFKSNRIRERPDEEERETSRLTGLGDISLTADYTLWRNRDVLPSTWLAARFFGKAPTGEDATRADGRIDPHLQLGTGSWDVGAGLGAGHRLDQGALYASAFYRMNQQGENNYEYGDVVLVNAALEKPVGALTGRSSAESTVVGLELNYRHARRDEFNGSAYRDSGGSVLYATPSFRFRLPGLQGSESAPSLRFSVQLPFGDGGLDGNQHEGTVWAIGLVVPLL